IAALAQFAAVGTVNASDVCAPCLLSFFVNLRARNHAEVVRLLERFADGFSDGLVEYRLCGAIFEVGDEDGRVFVEDRLLEMAENEDCNNDQRSETCKT